MHPRLQRCSCEVVRVERHRSQWKSKAGSSGLATPMREMCSRRPSVACSACPGTPWFCLVHCRRPGVTRSRAVIRQALRKNFVFASFDEEEVESFVEYMEKSTVKAGERLIAQGEQGDYFYIADAMRTTIELNSGFPMANLHFCTFLCSYTDLRLCFGVG